MAEPSSQDAAETKLPENDEVQTRISTDSETSEHVRKRLKKTSIDPPLNITEDGSQEQRDASAHSDVESNADVVGTVDSHPRGRLTRKRSIEEVDSNEAVVKGKQPRKRSRENGSSGVGEDEHDLSESPNATDVKEAGVSANSTPEARPQTPDRSMPDLRDESILISPKNKRTREQFLREHNDGTNQTDSDSTTQNATSAGGDSGQRAKRVRDIDDAQLKQDEASKATEEGKGSQLPPNSSHAKVSPTLKDTSQNSSIEDKQIPYGSGFSNTSTTSPFASLGSAAAADPSKTQPQTSASAFAASGFGKLASSSVSPFATASAGSTGSFGAFAGNSKPSALFGGTSSSDSKPGIGGFAAMGAQPETKSGFSTLGSNPSGFGGSLGSGSAFGSGFASVTKTIGGLSSFATPGTKGIVGLSDKPSKPFGAKEASDDEDEDDEGDDNDDESKSGSDEVEVKEDKKVKHFHEQDILTGEEEEETIYTARAKLFHFSTDDKGTKAWKERGLGVLRLNIRSDSATATENDDVGSDKQAGKPKARLILRTDGTGKVVLNSPISKDLTFGQDGKKPASNQILFQAYFEGQVQSMLLKMKQVFAEQLWEQIEEIKLQL